MSDWYPQRGVYPLKEQVSKVGWALTFPEEMHFSTDCTGNLNDGLGGGFIFKYLQVKS